MRAKRICSTEPNGHRTDDGAMPAQEAMARTVGQVEWVHQSRAAAHRPSWSEGGSATTSSGSTGNSGAVS